MFLWVEHVAHLGDMINACKILLGKPEGKSHLGDLGLDVRLLLKWI
jgi:hypothetical protein